MATVKLYRATCGSTYRVTTSPATARTGTTTIQAKRGPHSQDFGQGYPTTAKEVARLVAFDSFIEVPAP